MMRAMLYEAAQILLVRTSKWSWLKAWAMKIARHRGVKGDRGLGTPAGFDHAPHLGRRHRVPLVAGSRGGLKQV
jgi:hypothetical protein